MDKDFAVHFHHITPADLRRELLSKASALIVGEDAHDLIATKEEFRAQDMLLELFNRTKEAVSTNQS